jgi:poly-gamma-glutamate capsule biosynthesis protein CapA/YwtB (metallophosphatase superfamily)
MTTKTAPRRSLKAMSTSDLIAQYELAISSMKGRFTEKAPRQNRINYIVELIDEHADAGDTVADEWLRALV